MNNPLESRLTQSALGLSDKDFDAVPALERTLAETINSHIDTHHVSMGTVMTALACAVGEYVLLNGDEADKAKAWFVGILDAYVSTGKGGARTGPGDDRSLIRVLRPWQKLP